MQILNWGRKDESGQLAPSKMIIGSSNHFESGCYIDTCQIGNLNIFEARCNVGYGCEVKSSCLVKAFE